MTNWTVKALSQYNICKIYQYKGYVYDKRAEFIYYKGMRKIYIKVSERYIRCAYSPSYTRTLINQGKIYVNVEGEYVCLQKNQ